MIDIISILIPAMICLLISFIIIKKGVKRSKYNPLANEKGAILVKAKIERWENFKEWRDSVNHHEFVYRPLLTYSVNGIQYNSVDCCYRSYNPSIFDKYPIGTEINIVGIPSKFGKFKTEFGGYMFELYDEKIISKNNSGLKLIYFVIGLFFSLAGLSMLFDVIQQIIK